jgi:hypothetical protein
MATSFDYIVNGLGYPSAVIYNPEGYDDSAGMALEYMDRAVSKFCNEIRSQFTAFDNFWYMPTYVLRRVENTPYTTMFTAFAKDRSNAVPFSRMTPWWIAYLSKDMTILNPSRFITLKDFDCNSDELYHGGTKLNVWKIDTIDLLENKEKCQLIRNLCSVGDWLQSDDTVSTLKLNLNTFLSAYQSKTHSEYPSFPFSHATMGVCFNKCYEGYATSGASDELGAIFIGILPVLYTPNHNSSEFCLFLKSAINIVKGKTRYLRPQAFEIEGRPVVDEEYVDKFTVQLATLGKNMKSL